MACGTSWYPNKVIKLTGSVSFRCLRAMRGGDFNHRAIRTDCNADMWEDITQNLWMISGGNLLLDDWFLRATCDIQGSDNQDFEHWGIEFEDQFVCSK